MKKKTYSPTSVEFTKEKIGNAYYIRNQFDLTENPEVLTFNKNVFIQRWISLIIAIFYFYLLIQSIIIEFSLIPGIIKPDIFGGLQYYLSLAIIAIFNFDKSVKIWGSIGNFFLKFTSVITMLNASVILGSYFFDPNLPILSYPITFIFFLFAFFGSYFNFITAENFRVRFPNQMLLTREALRNYRKTLSYKFPTILLVTLVLVWFFSHPVGWVSNWFGYIPAGWPDSQLSIPIMINRIKIIEINVLGLIFVLIAIIASGIFSYFDVYIKAEHTAIKRGAFYEAIGKKVLICGAGAIGGITGAYLTMAGENVILYDTNVEHIDKMNSEGLEISGKRGYLRVKVKAASNLKDLEATYQNLYGDNSVKFDIIILAVKSAFTKPALKPLLPYMNEDTMVVSVQNSINDEVIEKIVGHERVIHGITFWGGTNIGAGKLEHTSIGHFQVGEISDKKDTPRIITLRKILGNFGNAEKREKIITDAWNKLLLNGVMNTYGLIFGERCYVLFNNPNILPIVIATIAEEAKVAKQIVGSLEKVKLIKMEDFDINKDAELEVVQGNGLILKILSSVSGRIKSSMLQDYERGARSENQYLLGLFIKENEIYSKKNAKDSLPIPFIKRAHEIADKVDNKELTPGLDNLKYFSDLLDKYPDYWKQPENFKYDSFKERIIIRIMEWAARVFTGNY
jgi:2-dehydropantoate 2-reductase